MSTLTDAQALAATDYHADSASTGTPGIAKTTQKFDVDVDLQGHNILNQGASGIFLLDEIKLTGSFAIPTTAITVPTAVQVPGTTVTPVCSGPIKIEFGMWTNHGSAGWAAGRGIELTLVDLSQSLTPIPLNFTMIDNTQVTGGAGASQFLYGSYTFNPGVGQFTYAVYAFLTSALITGASVGVSSTSFPSFVRVENDTSG